MAKSHSNRWAWAEHPDLDFDLVRVRKILRVRVLYQENKNCLLEPGEFFFIIQDRPKNQNVRSSLTI